MSVDITQWLDRVATRNTHVGIIGLGYVGLPLALLFAESGFRVTGLDIDAAKVDALNEDRSYIHRIPSASIVEARRAGFAATTDFVDLRSCDAVLICVPTPLLMDDQSRHEPDMSYITATATSLAPHVHTGMLVVLESTTWPGTTTELLLPLLRKVAGSEPLLAFSPEREDPGNATIDRRTIPKVLGGVTPEATRCAAALYGAVFQQTVEMSSPAAAEMTKLLENIYRSVNIALVNELKQLCLAMGVDIWEVIAAAATKPFGFAPFYPGPGIGGHCIPVDPFYLSWRAKQFDQPTRFIELAGEVNEAMPTFVVDTLEQAFKARGLGALEGKRLLLLGIAYKRDVDDLRESPALVIFELLRRRGATVAYNDPFFAAVGSGRHYSVEQTSTPLDQVESFDAVLLLTDHSAYEISKLVERSKLFVDTRNATQGMTDPNIVRC